MVTIRESLNVVDHRNIEEKPTNTSIGAQREFGKILYSSILFYDLKKKKLLVKTW